MKKTLVSLALAGAMMSGPAFAEIYQDFTIDEGSVPGAFDNVFVADKFNGSYSEIYTIYDTDGNPATSGLSFVTEAYADFTALLSDDGSVNTSNQLGSSPFNDNLYEIYALFDASGTVGVSGGGDILFNGQAGSFELYIDPNADTTKALGADGFSAVALDFTADDYLIASSTDLLSLKNVIGNPGAFDLWFDSFTLTVEGADYFIEPDPFYLVTNVDGDFDNITVADIQASLAATGSFTTDVTGDVSAVFPVPVPGTLALLGLGIFGLGAANRRRKSA
jgi:hypothetical protein